MQKIKSFFKKHWKQIIKYAFLIFLIVDGLIGWYRVILLGQPYEQLINEEEYLHDIKMYACILCCIEWITPMGYIFFKFFEWTNKNRKAKETC